MKLIEYQETDKFILRSETFPGDQKLQRLAEMLENPVRVTYFRGDGYTGLSVQPDTKKPTVEELFDTIAETLSEESPAYIKRQLEQQSERIVEEIKDGFWK